jgi:methionine sulfoxide reductase catalytic subunit
MQIRKPRSWELPDPVVTPEADYLRRRDFLRAVGLGVAATVIFPATIRAATAGFPDALDPAFKLDGVKLTPYNLITSYNNFCEWGLSKEDPQQLAKSWLEDRAVDS